MGNGEVSSNWDEGSTGAPLEQKVTDIPKENGGCHMASETPGPILFKLGSWMVIISEVLSNNLISHSTARIKRVLDR